MKTVDDTGPLISPLVRLIKFIVERGLGSVRTSRREPENFSISIARKSKAICQYSVVAKHAPGLYRFSRIPTARPFTYTYYTVLEKESSRFSIHGTLGMTGDPSPTRINHCPAFIGMQWGRMRSFHADPVNGDYDRSTLQGCSVVGRQGPRGTLLRCFSKD